MKFTYLNHKQNKEIWKEKKSKQIVLHMKKTVKTTQLIKQKRNFIQDIWQDEASHISNIKNPRILAIFRKD